MLTEHVPWDIQVHNDEFYPRVLATGSLGLGETYMEGWWDCEALDQFFFLILKNNLRKKVVCLKDILTIFKSSLFNFQKISKAFEIGKHHYDIGNELYKQMLDRRMIYSCGYWKNAETLDQAQEAKLELICTKLELAPGMKLLDIGCGWGGLAAYAAERFGVSVTGVTVSREQAEYAHTHCLNLPVKIDLRDYREMSGSFDRVVSVGMFEHVGYKNYLTFMKCVRNLLTANGLALLHTIGGNQSVKCVDKWIGRYIFPNSMLPSARQITKAIEGLFFIEDWHNFGTDYDTTLMHWFYNFDNAWNNIKGGPYNQRFYRMWKYYLLSCAGSFRARSNQLWQIVLSPPGRLNKYLAPR